MATRFIFSPGAAEYPSANFPQYMLVNQRPVLAFDASTDESCMWSGIIPQGWTGTPSAIVTYFMATATSGKVDFEGSVEAISDGDAVDVDAGDSFDTANTITAPTVPGTAGHIDQFTITLTNHDSSSAGDYFRFKLMRDADDATDDTATGDCYILEVEIRDSA